MLRQFFIVIGCLVMVMGCSTIPKYNIDLDNPLHKEIQTFFDKPFSVDLYTKDAQIQSDARYANEELGWGPLRFYSADEFFAIQQNMEKDLQSANYQAQPSKLINIEKTSEGVRVVRAWSYTGTFKEKYDDSTMYNVYDLVKSNSGWKIKYRKRLLKVDNSTGFVKYF